MEKSIMNEKLYILEHEKLMSEWDWEENNKLGLFPNKITQGSGKKVHWKCNNEHQWSAIVSSRVRGNNCPYCSGQVITISTETSLANKFPDIAKEWDYKKNYPLLPEDIYCWSTKIFFWICPKCGQSFPQSVRNRTKLNTKCTLCSKSPKVSEKHNLAVKRPDLAKEWDYVKNSPTRPEDITPQTNYSYWWICPKGHSFSATPNNRYRGKSQCTDCYLEENNLAAKNPELAKQWHPTKNMPLTSDKVTFGSNELVCWLCPVCNHEWQAKINNRNNGRGCPKCNEGTQTSAPEKIILEYVQKYFPDAIKLSKNKSNKEEIDVFIPPPYNVGIEYDGERHHQSELRYKNDTRKNLYLADNGIRLIRIREEKCHPMDETLCKIYSIKRVSDYSTLIPILEDILSDLTKSKIEIDPIEFGQIKNRVKTTLHIISDEESLATFMQQQEETGTPLKALWDYERNNSINLFPDKLTKGIAEEAHWICRKNEVHRFTQIINIIAGGGGCPKCYGRRKTTDEWIEEAKDKHGNKYDYSKVSYVNTNNDVIIICKKCGGEFPQNPSNHRSGYGCPFCAKQRPHVSNILATANPELAKEWDYEHDGNKGRTPNDVFITDDKNEYWWKCNNNKPHSYHARISYRIKRQSGCAVCHGKQVAWDTCLAYLRSDLVSEWYESNKLQPSEVTLKSEEKVFWKCPVPNHPTYEMRVCERVNAKFGCQICSGRKKTHEMYLSEISQKFPNIELLSTYKKLETRIECKCKICGRYWEPLPNNLRKTGCPQCKNKEFKNLKRDNK